MKVKAGDVVHVRCVVRRIGVCGLLVIDVSASAFDAEKGELHTHEDAIVHVETRPLQVGDKVTWGAKTHHFELLAECDGQAFLKPIEGGRCGVDFAPRMHPIDDLERVS